MLSCCHCLRRVALVATVVLLAASGSWAVSLRDIRTEVKDREGYTRCIVELTGKTEYLHRDFVAQKSYFLVDVYDVSPAVAERFITPATGPVRQIFVFNRKGPDGSQVLTLVFYLNDTRRHLVRQTDNPFRIVIDVVHSPDLMAQPLTAPAEPATPPTELTPLMTPGQVIPGLTSQGSRLPWDGKKKIVIIDPGHGGDDPGAVSNILRYRVEEKAINLAVALQLKRLIDASPNMEAHLTRTNDRYLSLDDRVRFTESRRMYADLFLSVHCNAAESRRNTSARGLELYYLNPRASSDGATRYIERLENTNGSEDGNFDTQEYMIKRMQSRAGGKAPAGSNLNHPILRVMAQEAFQANIPQSQRLCEHVKAYCYQITHYKLNNNREKVIKSARFRVLFQPDMPSVLVELGFLTNPDDCRKLVDAKFQQQAAIALYNGVASYFTTRDDGFSAKLLALPAGR